MNKDVFVIIVFLAMTFTLSLAGHVFFKKGKLQDWAIEKKIEKMHKDAGHGEETHDDHHDVPSSHDAHDDHDSHDDHGDDHH